MANFNVGDIVNYSENGVVQDLGKVTGVTYSNQQAEVLWTSGEWDCYHFHQLVLADLDYTAKVNVLKLDLAVAEFDLSRVAERVKRCEEALQAEKKLSAV